jgi:hypothetical protein
VSATAIALAGAQFPAVSQHYLLAARQMQAMSLAVHIPLVCFGIAFPALFMFAEWRYSRTLLFGLFLRGRFDPGAEHLPALVEVRGASPPGRQWSVRAPITIASLIAGVVLMVFFDPGWTHAVGVVLVVGTAASTFALAATVPDP